MLVGVIWPPDSPKPLAPIAVAVSPAPAPNRLTGFSVITRPHQ